MSRRVLCKIAAAVAVAGSLALGTVTTASAAGLAPPTPAGAAADAASRGGGGGVTPNGQLPEAIRVDEKAFKIVATFRGEGVQVYRTCNGDKFVAEPVATLQELRSKNIVGIHGAGPFWASLDGSKVTRDPDLTKPVAAARPEKIAPSDVDWLRVPVVSSPVPRGIFNNVAFVQRVDTKGGLPSGSCSASALPVSVRYSTNYVFWAPK